MYQYRKWIQKYKTQKVSNKSKQNKEFFVDETQINMGSKYIRLWVAIIKPKHRQILQIDISFERNMIIVERYIFSLINKYDR